MLPIAMDMAGLINRNLIGRVQVMIVASRRGGAFPNGSGPAITNMLHVTPDGPGLVLAVGLMVGAAGLWFVAGRCRRFRRPASSRILPADPALFHRSDTGPIRGIAGALVRSPVMCSGRNGFGMLTGFTCSMVSAVK
jgi:hypothetical protein